MTERKKSKEELVSTLIREYELEISADLRDFNYKVVKFYLTVMAWASQEENPTHLLSNAIKLLIFEALQAARRGHTEECLIWKRVANSLIMDHLSLDNMKANGAENSFINLDYAEEIKKYRRELSRYDIDLPVNPVPID